jgi:hypothetical protein
LFEGGFGGLGVGLGYFCILEDDGFVGWIEIELFGFDA